MDVPRGLAIGPRLVDGQGMRFLVVSALVLAGCSKSSPPAASDAALRFLPAQPELAVRIDLGRTRAWPHFATVTASVFPELQAAVDAARRACDLDVYGAARALVLARRGAAPGADLTVIATGLPRAEVTACLTKLASAAAPFALAVDGEVFHARVGDRPVAAGALLPTGDLVVVARQGAGIEPAAWKTEVGQGTAAGPVTIAWWVELDAAAPVALRTSSAQRTVVATIEPGDPLIIRGKLVAPSVAAANDDVARAKAILAYMTQASAGSGRLEPKGATVHADFTARGKEIDNLVATAVPALAAGATAPAEPPPPPASDTPRDCSELAPAVAQYLNESLAKAPAERRAALQQQLTTLVPALQQAYVEQCKAGAWAMTAIDCHVRNATALSRFERCRMLLSEDQRTRFDAAVTAALSAGTQAGAPEAPPTK